MCWPVYLLKMVFFFPTIYKSSMTSQSLKIRSDGTENVEQIQHRRAEEAAQACEHGQGLSQNSFYSGDSFLQDVGISLMKQD